MRTTRRTTTRAFSPDNTLNTSPAIDEQITRSEENLTDETTVEEIYTPGSLSKDGKTKERIKKKNRNAEEEVDTNGIPSNLFIRPPLYPTSTVGHAEAVLLFLHLMV